ncbi:hypothetical protein, conserved in T. vivax [Trypanosoma vivax Y486]|uniref:Uncharacterized protein n=1 Tax=Trypanosoma vivax (strain Y486) TaxID=1055687 RepID=F9WSK6_TRYVY|nr:hypothetical protein, conserved in T. vivax [Trypanosoma vivax Y486]|eukprot:CCD20545.1 hypothetical protein, conserved in T. vivax [Trypanosoma vivax Y486]
MVLPAAAKKRDAAVLSVLRFLVLSLGVLFARHCLLVSSHFVPSGQCALAALVAFSVLLFACFVSPRRVSPVLVSVGRGCFVYACLSVSVSCVVGFVHMFLAWPAVGGMLFVLSVLNFVSAFRASRMRAMRSASVFSRSWAPSIVENEVAALLPLPLALFVLSPAGVIRQIPAQSTCLALFVANSMTPAGFFVFFPRMTVSGHPFESSPTVTPVDSVNVGTASWALSVLPDRKGVPFSSSACSVASLRSRLAEALMFSGERVHPSRAYMYSAPSIVPLMVSLPALPVVLPMHILALVDVPSPPLYCAKS